MIIRHFSTTLYIHLFLITTVTGTKRTLSSVGEMSRAWGVQYPSPPLV